MYWKSIAPRTHPAMECVCSKIEPLVCESDKEQFLAHWSHCKADNRVYTSQSSSDISFVKVDGKENWNMGPGSSCPSVHWYGELPEIMVFILLFLFVLTIFRRWQNKRRAKAMRRALSQTMALQTVSSTVPYNNGPDLAWRGMGNRCLD